MTTSAYLVDLVVAALLGPQAGADPAGYATAAGQRIYRPGDWPTQALQYPIIKLRVPRELKQSIARSGAPEFTVTTTIRIVGEVSEPAAVNDAGVAAAEAALWQLQREIEVAVINSYPLTTSIQQIASVDSQLSYNSDAETHLAGIQIDLALEFYQGAEDFAPVPADDLNELHADFVRHPPAGLIVNLDQ